jgi:L-ascorbate metabolism protein UlaG (beta-lactamase superfamily)
MILVAKIVLLIIGSIAVLYACLKKWQFGKRASRAQSEKWQSSPRFNTAKQVFQNQNPRPIHADFNFPQLLKGFLLGRQIRTPTEPLPVTKPDLKDFLKEDESFKWIWLGHSSVYLHVNGVKIITDPVYSGSASPFWFVTRRFQKPVLSLQETPRPDVVLISHDHYDHLDARTIRFFAKDPPQFVTALGVGARLQSWGIPKEKIIELDWHEAAQFKNLKLTAVPAQHFSGREIGDQLRTLWASWIFVSLPREGQIADHKQTIYFSADSGYADHFKQIGSAYGPFDHAFLECGQYNLMWRFVHMLPEEILQAAQDLGLKRFSPIHWGMFSLSMHDWFEPIERVTRLAEQKNLQVWQPRLGEVVRFSHGPRLDKWWQAHPDFKKRGSML